MQFLGKIIAWRQSVNDKGRKNGPASLLLTTGCGFILIGILYGPCSFPLCFGPLLTLNSGAWCLLGGILMLTAILTARSIIVPIHASGWILPLIAMLLSDLAYRRSSFFQTDYWPLILALAALITYGFLKIERRRAVAFMPALLLIVTAFSGVISFLLESNGRLIFSDDMPPFLYRLMQLKENFPLIPFYNPEWNGGVEAREFFPSGSLNIFFLWFPVIKLADLRSVFTPLVGITVFLFIPACICCAARLLNLGRNAACFAAVLSLCCSIEWYRWSLLYGTLPFITAAGLFPLNVALCIRAAKENFNRLHALVFFCSMSLMAFWTPSLLAIAPVALCTLLHRRAWKENRAFTLVLILLAILHLPWILLFLKASQVGDFILAQQSSEAAALPASVHTAPFSLPALSRHGFMKATLGTIREFTRNTHPLLLFLIVPAFGLTISARSRGYIAAILVTILLSIAGPVVKPAHRHEKVAEETGLRDRSAHGPRLRADHSAFSVSGIDVFQRKEIGAWWRRPHRIAAAGRRSVMVLPVLDLESRSQRYVPDLFFCGVHRG